MKSLMSTNMNHAFTYKYTTYRLPHVIIVKADICTTFKH